MVTCHIQNKKICAPPLQLHGQTNQRTHNDEKEEQKVKLCISSTNAVIATSHVANKKKLHTTMLFSN